MATPIYVQLSTNDHEELAKVVKELEDLGLSSSYEIRSVLRGDQYCVRPPILVLLLSMKRIILYTGTFPSVEGRENRLITYSSREELISFIVDHSLELG